MQLASSRSIYKYPIDITDEQAVYMPKGSTILHVAEQQGRVCLWAMVDPGAKTATRRILVFGTGHPCDDAIGMNYVGSVLIAGGQLVFHVFDAGEV